jgi:hypothetical protein
MLRRVKAYASRTGTRRNLKALAAAGWGLFVSAAGVHRNEGFRFVIDNGAWTAHTHGQPWTPEPFQAVLAKLGHLPECEGVVAPDVVNGGAESLALSLSWLDDLLATIAGVVYLPVQPGIPPHEVAPHLRGRVGVFIGGDSGWKEQTAASWARLAHDHGALCHMGRVNSLRRLLLAKAAGCDSFDGSGPSRFEKHLHEMEAARRHAAQLGLVLLVELDCFYEDDGAVLHVRLTLADFAPLEAILLAALDRGAVGVFEVQTDAGLWSCEDRPGWHFETWDQLAASA